MKGYDCIFIVKADLGSDEVSALVTQFKGWVSDNEGEITLLDELGSRELATPIGKDETGIYVHCQFNGSNATLEALANQFKVTETIIRHIIVTLDSIQEPAEA